MDSSEEELALLRDNRHILEIALRDNLSPILEELNSKGLIKHDVYQRFKDSDMKLSASEKVSMVLSCLRDKVELNPRHLLTFVSIISAPNICHYYEDVIRILDRKSPQEISHDCSQEMSTVQVHDNTAMKETIEKVEKDDQNASNYIAYQEFEKEVVSRKYPHLVAFITSQKYDIYKDLNSNGEKLLHLACRDGRLDIVRMLIEIYDCSFSVRDKAGNTPVHTACIFGQFSVVAYFYYQHDMLGCGTKNHKNMSFLHVACQSTSMALIRLITYFSIARVKERQHPKLIQFEDDILFEVFSQAKFVKLSNSFEEAFRFNKNFSTPLHVACRSNNLAAIKLFFSEINLVLNFDFKQYISSVLTLACQLRHFDIIDYLLNDESKPIFSNPITSKKSVRHDWKRNRELLNSYDVDDVLDESDEFDESIMESYYEEDAAYSSKHFNTRVRSLHSKTEKQSTSLEINIIQFSIKRGDHALFSHLRNNHCDDTKIQSDDLLLHSACMSGDLEMVTTIYQYLVKHMPALEVIDARNHLGNTCMHIACEWGSLEIVQYLFTKDFRINVSNKHGDTPLHIAIRHKKKEIFDYLLKCKADVNVANVHKVTPLHIATCHQNDLYYTTALLDQNSCNTWNNHDKYGDTPLFNALKTRNKEMLSLLLQNPNCDILAINKVKGETAANIAARFQDLELLQLFLSQKKSYPMKLQNYMGQTLVHFACWKNDISMIRLLGNADNNYNLSEDINLLDKMNELTPLQFACMKNDLKLVTYFLNLPDSYPDVKSKNGETVLHICSRQNMRDMAEVCVEKCSVLARNDNFDTPLHIACYKKKL